MFYTVLFFYFHFRFESVIGNVNEYEFPSNYLKFQLINYEINRRRFTFKNENLFIINILNVCILITQNQVIISTKSFQQLQFSNCFYLLYAKLMLFFGV